MCEESIWIGYKKNSLCHVVCGEKSFVCYLLIYRVIAKIKNKKDKKYPEKFGRLNNNTYLCIAKAKKPRWCHSSVGRAKD